jgi:hypothetical protein
MRFELGIVTEEQLLAYFRVSTRLDRAIGMLDHVERNAPGIALVRSASKPKVRYVTDLRAGTCECADFVFRGSINGTPCKHLLAARLKERLENE